MKHVLLVLLIILSACVSRDHLTDEAKLVSVKQIVDGDTFWAEYESKERVKVRLIGIDAPETRPSQYKEIGYFGEEAKTHLRSLIADKEIFLQFDIDTFDQYGRTLAYVYLEDGRFVNAEMIAGGYAKVVTFPPNVKHVDFFIKLQRKARKEGVGVWDGQGQ